LKTINFCLFGYFFRYDWSSDGLWTTTDAKNNVRHHLFSIEWAVAYDNLKALCLIVGKVKLSIAKINQKHN
jgi:hypothetical protein